MQVTETLNSGLKREIKVTVPAGDMEARLAKRLSDAKNKVRINGFRPGKVPMQHMRKMYGKSFMAEVVNEILSDSTRTIISDRGEKAAMQPDVTMTEDEKEAEKILAGGADFEFSLSYEVIPAIEIKEFSDIKVSRPVYDVPESEIDEQVNRVAESARTYEPKKGKAEEGDRLTIDYVGKIDGVAFDDFRDVDDVFAPMIEVHTAGGEYMWVPTERLRMLSFDAPKRPRDLFWRRATIEMKDGQEGVVYIPMIYPWTPKDAPNPVRLGRATEWQEEGGLVRGLGMRDFLVGEEAKTLAELEEISFD